MRTETLAKAKISKTLTSADKSALLDDAVFYEILFALGVSLHDPTDYCVWEHLNFSRMGHARALIYFFECNPGSKKWDDDLVSGDFGFPPEQVGISQAERDRLNKDLFHLSSSRLRHSAETKPWTNEILNRVHERTVSFIQFLLSDKRPLDFQVSERKWKSLLELLESGQELTIARFYGVDGRDTGWLLGKGRSLPSHLSGLTLLERKA
jgi:hypothetical protein